ncbi:MAG TPA: MBL fold metallo-hydrolase [Polyangiaceae bacterium]|nr:MBL fold metallo-hydrolase [Polyangiaceae bacterium]
MKKAIKLFESGAHSWQVIARDPELPNYLIDTNEYLISAGEVALLTDPGGQEIFPAVFSALSAATDPRKLTHVFASHQDPDVISSLALWLGFKPDLRCYASWLWSSFIPHFGGTKETFIQVPDAGMNVELGGLPLQILPAHYLHSSGNLHLYDPTAKILFSGDVGAALLPPEHDGLFVTDFDRHVRFAEGFHRRWMGSAEARDQWCELAAKLPIDMLCPQHGAIYRGADVERFINWFAELKIGVLRRAG